VKKKERPLLRFCKRGRETLPTPLSRSIGRDGGKENRENSPGRGGRQEKRGKKIESCRLRFRERQGGREKKWLYRSPGGKSRRLYAPLRNRGGGTGEALPETVPPPASKVRSDASRFLLLRGREKTTLPAQKDASFLSTANSPWGGKKPELNGRLGSTPCKKKRETAQLLTHRGEGKGGRRKPSSVLIWEGRNPPQKTLRPSFSEEKGRKDGSSRRLQLVKKKQESVVQQAEKRKTSKSCCREEGKSGSRGGKKEGAFLFYEKEGGREGRTFFDACEKEEGESRSPKYLTQEKKREGRPPSFTIRGKGEEKICTCSWYIRKKKKRVTL